MKNPGDMTKAEADEEANQFVEAIMAGIEVVAVNRAELKQNLHLPCLLGALCSVVAYHMAGIPAERRSEVYSDFGDHLVEHIDRMNKTPGGTARVFDNTKPLQ